jgi:hypothetical protein
MAVVQQLAMVTADELNACSINEDALRRLVSFSFDSDRYHDLDWAPHGLKISFERSGQSSELQQALKWSLEGQEVVNPQWPEGPGNNWVYSPITFLEADKVELVSQQLQQIDIGTIFDWMPKLIDPAWKALGQDVHGWSIHPRTYHSEKLRELIAFYKTASRKHMATVMWWD